MRECKGDHCVFSGVKQIRPSSSSSPWTCSGLHLCKICLPKQTCFPLDRGTATVRDLYLSPISELQRFENCVGAQIRAGQLLHAADFMA